jgi:hypothetical protein
MPFPLPVHRGRVSMMLKRCDAQDHGPGMEQTYSAALWTLQCRSSSSLRCRGRQCLPSGPRGASVKKSLDEAECISAGVYPALCTGRLHHGKDAPFGGSSDQSRNDSQEACRETVRNTIPPRAPGLRGLTGLVAMNRIGGFDAQEKPVARCQGEPWHVEHRVVHQQAAGAEARTVESAAKRWSTRRDHDVCGPAMQRASAMLTG